MFAMTSKASVAVVLMAPVIIIAACCCIDVSLVSIACFALLFSVFLPMFCFGVRNMSVAYNICGIVMDRYSWQKYLACTPFDVCAILLNWINHSWPFVSVVAYCAFQFSLLLIMTSRNLMDSFDGMH